MFRNVGEKLKVVAIISLIIGIIASFIIGIVEIIGLQFIVGIITIALGIVSSLIPAWVLYAIGEIAENTEAILSMLVRINSNNENNTKIKPVGKYADSKDDSWICSCGERNPNIVSSCQICNRSRPANNNPNIKYADSKDDTWICSCGAKNSCQNSTCFTCLKLRQR